ncbi:MAG: hypothetical protein Q9M20_04615 [Mariprofundaceae bacterium]|nr:hypothetical protein [Mariprofundaceae bacterium]
MSVKIQRNEACQLTLVLNADNSPLNEEQRRYLAQLPASSLQLYQLTACQVGESFTLTNALDIDALGLKAEPIVQKY